MYCCLTSFFPVVDICLTCEHTAGQSCAMVGEHAMFHRDPSNRLAAIHQHHRQTDRTDIEDNGPIAQGEVGEPFCKRSPNKKIKGQRLI